MNYCSIQDAWGSSVSNSFNKYMENKSNLNKPEIEKKTTETFHEYNCNDFFLHLQKCKKCQMMINNNNNNNNSSITQYLLKLSKENKDFIILGLIILFILLFINLVNNLTKN
jgi:hypothetical protein